MDNYQNLDLNQIADTMTAGQVTILASANADEAELALRLAIHFGLDKCKQTAVLSDKTPLNGLLQKLTALYGGLHAESVMFGNGDETAWQAYGLSNTFAVSRVFCSCQDNLDIDTAVGKLNRLAQYVNIDLVTLSLNAFNSAKCGEVFKQYADNLFKVRAFAKENNCHVIVATHCDTHFYEWRVLSRLIVDNVQLLRMSSDDKFGLYYNLENV